MTISCVNNLYASESPRHYVATTPFYRTYVCLSKLSLHTGVCKQSPSESQELNCFETQWRMSPEGEQRPVCDISSIGSMRVGDGLQREGQIKKRTWYIYFARKFDRVLQNQMSVSNYITTAHDKCIIPQLPLNVLILRQCLRSWWIQRNWTGEYHNYFAKLTATENSPPPVSASFSASPSW